MAARSATKSRRTTKKAAPVEEDLDDDLDVEVEDDEEEEAPAPKRRSKKAAAPASKKAAKAEAETLGTAWLKEHVNDTLGADHESTKLRIVLRKLGGI